MPNESLNAPGRRDLRSAENRAVLAAWYGEQEVENNLVRMENLQSAFEEYFGVQSTAFYSTPGRTELSGNHTDHNHGCVLAASVSLDSLAVAAPCEGSVVTLYSEGYDAAFSVDIADLDVKTEQFGSTESLIRGVAAGFRERDLTIGAFNAVLHSTVLPGSGLSSSASIEVLIGTILNELYNDAAVDYITLAQIGQFAENRYFGKPCGLMDQVACASGGIVTIDFRDPASPVVEQMHFAFRDYEHELFVVDTGGSHADLTDDYASIPADMKAVAAEFGKEVCREIDRESVENRLPELRKKVGDRAILRALHFFDENARVRYQVKALKTGDFETYLGLMRASGLSSFCFLQNVVPHSDNREQGITLALNLADRLLDGDGASRVHGGGFAGTIQALVPFDRSREFVTGMERFFGPGSVTGLAVRNQGAGRLPLK